jgi:predicted DsbA family dithiol-disulfide isomerase
LVFRFDKVKRIPNTFKAHQLIWLAEKHGVQEGVARDLYRAYFEQGIDIGDSGELEKIAARHGIPPTEVQSLWNDKLGKGEVSLMEQESVSLGISGVPAFIIQNKWLVRGAQPPETFLDIFSGISREGDPSPKDMRAVN